MKTDNVIFEDFAEYWSHTKLLSPEQRDIIFNSLPEAQQKMIQKSYHEGAWEDIFMRNHLDKCLDDLKNNHDLDILAIKTQVLSGHSHFMKLSDWVFLENIFKDYDSYHTQYIFGGINIEHLDDNAILITKKREN